MLASSGSRFELFLEDFYIQCTLHELQNTPPDGSSYFHQVPVSQHILALHICVLDEL